MRDSRPDPARDRQRPLSGTEGTATLVFTSVRLLLDSEKGAFASLEEAPRALARPGWRGANYGPAATLVRSEVERRGAAVFERIVVAYDGSDPAHAAARLAFRIGSACSAAILLVHVIERSEGLPVHAELLPDFESQLETQRDHWLAVLDQLRELAPDDARVSSRVFHGQPAERLLEAAGDHAADLIVTGTHGVGGLKPLLGSVSHQIVENAVSRTRFDGDRFSWFPI